MTNSHNKTWKCKGGRNGKAFHSLIEVSSERCPICDEPYSSQQTETQKRIPPALKFILVVDIIVIIIGAFAYLVWFRGCPIGQEKIGVKCVAKVSPSPSPIVSPEIVLNSSQTAIPSPLPPSPQPTPTPPNADQTWQKIQQQIKDPNSKSAEIDQALQLAETEFPNDYRFTYERVSFKVKNNEFIEHHQAFDALTEAAKKAINQGKAQTMLDSLKADAQQDAKIKKLAIGHYEWDQIIQALEQNNANLLK